MIDWKTHCSNLINHIYNYDDYTESEKITFYEEVQELNDLINTIEHEVVTNNIEHCATPEQWAMIATGTGGCFSAALLELRSRIETLERNAAMTKLKTTTPQSKSTGGLLERVSNAIHDVEFPHGTDEARAAIHEVMLWFRSIGRDYSAIALEHEMNHN